MTRSEDAHPHFQRFVVEILGGVELTSAHVVACDCAKLCCDIGVIIEKLESYRKCAAVNLFSFVVPFEPLQRPRQVRHRLCDVWMLFAMQLNEDVNCLAKQRLGILGVLVDASNDNSKV